MATANHEKIKKGIINLKSAEILYAKRLLFLRQKIATIPNVAQNDSNFVEENNKQLYLKSINTLKNISQARKESLEKRRTTNFIRSI